ncbi:dihydrodipicolinate synthase family protein [Aspergillus glaucus CBS 516.65]|uniref:Dihydrodipicolinate synthase n=1 Tax=Aspergillus glaucus CBS 516.65 TaxID=1160497 RepID=A0A1L9V4C5_ASPGL|nr:hypothetical protein ASPGLDRAFT_70594 [Aspergillus glaucus CBS 516.65]OJJ78768.1 hypothetical protein ASPGLDRAFT_70594 [Aspergillus glaucus CBS 516.65]
MESTSVIHYGLSRSRELAQESQIEKKRQEKRGEKWTESRPAAIRTHTVCLAKASLVSLVTMDPNGEAVHLFSAERQTVIRETRMALADASFANVPVIAGASEQSIRGTVELCHESANCSPIPLIIYNYLGAVAGIDMDSDLLICISQHPNIVGTKFTCGNTGKLTRVAAALHAVTPTSPLAPSTRKIPCIKTTENHPYVVFGGIADFSLQTLASGGSVILAGSANVIPRLCVHIFNLWGEGRFTEAIEVQHLLSAADWGRLSGERIEGVKEGIQEMMEVERDLPDSI